MKKCLLVINSGKTGARSAAKDIQDELQNHGIECGTLLFPDAQPHIPVLSDSAGQTVDSALFSADYSFAVTLGGDGTVLFAARLCAPLGIPILPVNFGSFGFICGIKKDEWKTEILKFLDGKADINERSMAEAVVMRDGKIAGASSALNDIVVTAKSTPRIITLNVSCNDISFGQFKSDALIFSTATGSTAYSAAAGGPIIDPSVDAFVLTPVCPFSLSSRPLVLSSASEVHITPADFQQEIQVFADGQLLCAIEDGDSIVIRKSQYAARLHAGSSAQFYAALRAKMNWSGGPVA